MVCGTNCGTIFKLTGGDAKLSRHNAFYLKKIYTGQYLT